MTNAVSALLLLAAALTQGAPGPMKVSDLNSFCSSRNETDLAACRFYIFGVFEGLNIGARTANDEHHFCVPDGTKQKDMVAVVKEKLAKDLAVFPDDKDMPAVSFVGAVLQISYPCTKN